MVDQSVVTSVRTYLHRLREHGLAVRFGVIFGSWASGGAGPWSDIDVLVVSPRFNGTRSRRDVDLLWRQASRSDTRIEPVPCGDQQWEQDDSSPVVELARREGTRVDVDVR